MIQILAYHILERFSMPFVEWWKTKINKDIFKESP
jgi:hypothetical protein